MKLIFSKELPFFFVLTYLLSWIFWLPAVLSPKGTSESVLLSVLYVLGGFGPSIVGFIAAYYYEGKKGMKSLLNKALHMKISIKWLVIVIMTMPIIASISLIIFLSFGGKMPETQLLENPILILPVLFSIFFLGGPVAEEFGWRGFALDRLLKKYSLLTSSIVLGIIWSFWHTPLFFIANSNQSELSFPLFVLNGILLSILFTWLHHKNNGNILVALIFHTMINFTYSLIPLTLTDHGLMVAIVVTFVLDIVVIFSWYNRNNNNVDATLPQQESV